MADPTHVERINAELRGVGATDRAMKKFSKRSLYDVIHPDEHVTGVLYGRYGEGGFNWYGGMLVATDKRMIFFDLTPGVKDFMEITYDIITAIEQLTTGPFTGVTLHTGVRDYSFKLADTHSAENFVRYVEQRRLESAGKFDPNMYEAQDDYRDSREENKQ